MIDNVTDTVFSLEELKTINKTISAIYKNVGQGHTSQMLSDFSMNFLAELNELVSFDKANIMLYSYNSKTNTYEVSSFFHAGWHENDVDSYINRYCHIDDVLPILSDKREIAFMNGNIFSSREQTQYYKEFVEPAQIVNSIDANILLPESLEIKAILGAFRDKTGFSQKDLEIIKTYQPHLSNALSQFLDLKRDPSDDLIEVFTNIETICACVLNDDLKLVTYNTAFRSFVETLSGCSVFDSKLTLELKNLCAHLKASVEYPKIKKYGPVSILVGGQSYAVEIVYSKNDAGPGKFICLLLTNNFALRLEKLQTTFYLSSRECEVLSLILEKGMTCEEISSCLFISSSTVKKHLTSAYQKVGVSNQKQLNSLFRKL